MIAEIARMSQDDAPLLLVGEPSSGKRYYARLFHEKSARAAGPYVMIQCAGLVDSESLARAFGIERRATSRNAPPNPRAAAR